MGWKAGSSKAEAAAFAAVIFNENCQDEKKAEATKYMSLALRTDSNWQSSAAVHLYRRSNRTKTVTQIANSAFCISRPSIAVAVVLASASCAAMGTYA